MTEAKAPSPFRAALDEYRKAHWLVDEFAHSKFDGEPQQSLRRLAEAEHRLMQFDPEGNPETVEQIYQRLLLAVAEQLDGLHKASKRHEAVCDEADRLKTEHPELKATERYDMADKYIR
jgi:hypothetical protein